MYFYTIELCFKLFYFSGTHPRKGYSIFQLFLFTFNLFSAALLIFLVIFQFHDGLEKNTFVEVSNAASCVLLMIHCIVKAVTIFAQKYTIVDLLETMNYYFWRLEDISSMDEKNNFMKAQLELKNKFRVFFGFYATTLVAFVMGPCLSNEDILSYECYRPPWIPYYCLLFLNNSIGVICTLFSMIPVDVFFLTLATLTKIQFKLLNGELEILFDIQMKSDKHLEYVDAKLRRCIRHHFFLLNFVDRITRTFSIMLVFYIGIILITMCIEMYRVSTLIGMQDVLESLMYVSSGLYEFIFCYCLPVQGLIDEVRKVSEKVYLSEWYKFGTHAKPLLMIIAIGQRDINIKAGGIVNIDLKTGLNTIKSMISYCMFLKTMSNSQ